jgi:hypothetical protein
MKNQKYSNIETLTIIVAAWNLGMADANAICAKADLKPDHKLADLASFIMGKDIPLNEIYLPKNDFANQSIEYYNKYSELSKFTKYTKWKSLKRNHLIKTYGVMFEIYLQNNFNTDFLNYLPFFKMSERQFAKIFIEIKHIV